LNIGFGWLGLGIGNGNWLGLVSSSHGRGSRPGRLVGDERWDLDSKETWGSWGGSRDRTGKLAREVSSWPVLGVRLGRTRICFA
jgi:hypothetical protein